MPAREYAEAEDLEARSIFDRYNIVSEPDLRQAANRLAAYVGSVGT